MTSRLVLPLSGLQGVRTRDHGFTIDLGTRWTDVAEAWTGGATPFQSALWLGSWYESFADRAGLTPLLVTVWDARTGELAMHLPLVLDRSGPLSEIAFADLHLTDYNAPLLGPAAPGDAAGARALWRAVRAALPPADLIRLVKMRETVGARPNPLALLNGAAHCALSGNVVDMGDDYDAWRHTLDRRVRKELERSWRVFSKVPGARLDFVTDPARAEAIVAAMEEQQQTRMGALGLDYRLNQDDVARFYRRIIARGLGAGTVVLSTLSVGEEVVAALLGLMGDDGYVMIRISHAGEPWSHCSPGRLVIERTMAALHAGGTRCFDFSVGDYDYKRRFGVVALPLVDLVQAAGPRGFAASMRARAMVVLRRHPEVERRLRAWHRGALRPA